MLNVGHRHRWRANINPALVQSIVLVPEWILPSSGEAGPTFNRRWIGVSLDSVALPKKALSSVEWFMARVGEGGPALNRHCVDVLCLLGIVC